MYPSLIFLLFLGLGMSLFAQSAKVKQPNPKQVNADDMWVASPVPELPTGVTHHTFHSDSMRRLVGYSVYLPPDYRIAPRRRYPVIYVHQSQPTDTGSMWYC